MTVIDQGNEIYIGLSTDTKPTTVPAGARFIETDTAMLWQYNGSSWSLGKYTAPTPNIVRIGIFDGGTISNMLAVGICGTGGSRITPTGTGATGRTAATSTEGQAMNASTGTTANAQAGFGQGNAFVVPAAQFYFRCRFRVNQSTTNNQLWIGFTSTAQASVVSDTPLANASGVMFGFKSGATNWTVIQNNGNATQYDNLVSTNNFPTNAVDTNWHTVEIYTLDNGSHFQYSLDGATAFQLATTQLPSTTSSYQFFGAMSNNNTTNSFNWDCQYCWMSMSPNNK